MINLAIPYAPKKVAGILFSIVLFLTSAHIVTQASKYFWEHERLLGLVKTFDLNREGNIPSWYSSFALLFCAFLLANIAYFKKGSSFGSQWKILSFIFLYLSVDEAAELHEKLNFLLRPLSQSGTPLAFPWIIPGSIFAGLVLLYYLKFLGHLPNKTRLLFLLGGAIYLSGALGSEVIEGYFLGASNIETFAFQLSVALEESLEMFGSVIFAYALLSYLQDLSKDDALPAELEHHHALENAVDFSASQKAIQE
jgi:hypothetical protein